MTAPAAAVGGGVSAGRTAGDEMTVAIAVGDGGRPVGWLRDGDRVGGWLEGDLVGDELYLSGTAPPSPAPSAPRTCLAPNTYSSGHRDGR